MTPPDWAVKFRRPGTELQRVNDALYKLYEQEHRLRNGENALPHNRYGIHEGLFDLSVHEYSTLLDGTVQSRQGESVISRRHRKADCHCLDPWTAETSGKWLAVVKVLIRQKAIKNTEERQKISEAAIT